MTRSFALLALLFPLTASAQFEPDEPAAKKPPRSFAEIGSFTAEVVPAKARRGQTVAFRLTATPKAGAWTYPVHPKNPDQSARNKFMLPPPGAVIFVGPTIDPPGAKEKPDVAGGGKTNEYYPRAATWELAAVVARDAAPGKARVALAPGTSVQMCNDYGCIPSPPKDLPAADLEVLDGEPVEYETRYVKEINQRLADAKAAAATIPATAVPAGPASAAAPAEPRPGGRKAAKLTPDYEAGLKDVLSRLDKAEDAAATQAKAEPLGGFLLTAALWGLISLVTPCVFPMIPITVSIFLHKSHGSTAVVLKQAAVYCLTIITVLGASAFALLKFMAWLSAHPVTNVLLGLLFLVLALSLFGMYELTLPNFMVRKLQRKQAEGGILGTVFGALAFTVISFTCVAPFLGGFAGISAADAGGSLVTVPTLREVLGGLAFATAFAAPFFVLALFPRLLKQLPRSGSWLDSVKVVMGFLELAAALKFLRTAELRVFSPPQYFTYDLVLGGWVALAFACGLYLLNVYRLPHDEDKGSIGVPRLLFALGFLGFGFYLLPAVFKGPDGRNQRPAGAVYAWVDAFLLPEPVELPFSTDLKDAADRARAEALRTGVPAKPVLLDFTGVTCTNCKYNEANIFTQAAVKEMFARYDLVQLYTDEVPATVYAAAVPDAVRTAEAVANRQFKIDAFGTDQLPLYAVVQPQVSGKVRLLGVYPEGKINDPDKFVRFLDEALRKAGN